MQSKRNLATKKPKKIKKQIKLLDLNFNLINTIFSYLHLEKLTSEALKLNKKITFALKQLKLLKILKANQDLLLKHLTPETLPSQIFIENASEYGISESNKEDLLLYILQKQKGEKSLCLLESSENKNEENYAEYLLKLIDSPKQIKFFSLNRITFLFEKPHCFGNMLQGLAKKDIEIFWILNCPLLVEEKKNEQFLIAVADLIKKTNSINRLTLSGLNLGSNIVIFRLVCEAIKANKTLISLDLSRNKLGDNTENVRCLCEALKLNSSIELCVLDLNNLGRNEENLCIIADLLHENKSLKYLSVKDIDPIYLYSNFIRNVNNKRLLL